MQDIPQSTIKAACLAVGAMADFSLDEIAVVLEREDWESAEVRVSLQAALDEGGVVLARDHSTAMLVAQEAIEGGNAELASLRETARAAIANIEAALDPKTEGHLGLLRDAATMLRQEVER